MLQTAPVSASGDQPRVAACSLPDAWLPLSRVRRYERGDGLGPPLPAVIGSEQHRPDVRALLEPGLPRERLAVEPSARRCIRRVNIADC